MLRGLGTRSTAVAAAALLAAAPAAAGPDPASLAIGMQELTAMDAQVAGIAYRLSSGAAPLCPGQTALPGFVVQHISQYRPDLRPVAEQLYDFGGGAAVVAVVPGSVAERVGLRVRDRILAINGAPVDAVAEAKRHADDSRITVVLSQIEQAFAAGLVKLTISRAGQVRDIFIRGGSGCASTVQLDLSERVDAGADGRIVTVSRGMVDKAGKLGLVFVIAHELAHNILHHGEWLDGQGVNRGWLASFGKNRTRILATEMEADYWGVYLMAVAGYRIEDVPEAWRGIGKFGPGIFGDGTHLGTGSRARFLERVVAEIRDKRARGAPLRPDYAAFAAEDGGVG